MGYEQELQNFSPQDTMPATNYPAAVVEPEIVILHPGSSLCSKFCSCCLCFSKTSSVCSLCVLLLLIFISFATGFTSLYLLTTPPMWHGADVEIYLQEGVPQQWSDSYKYHRDFVISFDSDTITPKTLFTCVESTPKYTPYTALNIGFPADLYNQYTLPLCSTGSLEVNFCNPNQKAWLTVGGQEGHDYQIHFRYEDNPDGDCSGEALYDAVFAIAACISAAILFLCFIAGCLCCGLLSCFCACDTPTRTPTYTRL